MGINCTTDYKTGCVSCPDIPASPAAPAQSQAANATGWNAGANSIAQIDGNLHTVFSFNSPPAGVVTGFKNSRSKQTDPNQVLYGFYVYAIGQQAYVKVLEKSVTRFGPVPYTLGTNLEIRRTSGFVDYLIDGVHVYHSSTPSAGPLMLNACLYASGDIL